MDIPSNSCGEPKKELNAIKTDLADFRQHVDARFDKLKNQLDFSERIRIVERRLAKT
jgi:hypothetical protein